MFLKNQKFILLIGAKQHGGEAGIGVTPQVALNKAREGFPYRGITYNARVGYRFQPLREGVTARIAWVPTIAKVPLYSDYALELGKIGLSIGYSFK